MTDTQELEDNFKFATQMIEKTYTNNKNIVSDNIKLQFYGLYKQATIGNCNIPQPYFINVAERKKYDAWNNLINMSKETAMKKYCELYLAHC